MRDRRAEDKARITDLPDELLLQITSLLQMDDILKLRLTCTELAPAALTSVQSRMKIVYIHPSITSLRAVPDICAHPFSKAIEEVILLGKIPHEEVVLARQKDPKGKTLNRRFATWPLFFPRARSVHRIAEGEEDQQP